MAIAAAPASASTSGRDAPSAVCLVPFRWRARVREEAAEEGGARYAATPAASPSYYGLRLLHSSLQPDLVLRLDRGECRAGGGGAVLLAAGHGHAQRGNSARPAWL